MAPFDVFKNSLTDRVGKLDEEIETQYIKMLHILLLLRRREMLQCD